MQAGRSGAAPVLDHARTTTALDWQIWFAAMGAPREYPWTLHLVWKLLEADPARSACSRATRSRRAAALRPRRSLPLSLRAAATQRRLVAARARRRPGCRPCHATTRSCRSICAVTAGCAIDDGFPCTSPCAVLTCFPISPTMKTFSPACTRSSVIAPLTVHHHWRPTNCPRQLPDRNPPRDLSGTNVA